MMITILLTLAVTIYFVSFLVLAALRKRKVYPFVPGSDQRDAWLCLFDVPVVILIVISYLSLIRIFWGYVINVNQVMDEIK